MVLSSLVRLLHVLHPPPAPAGGVDDRGWLARPQLQQPVMYWNDAKDCEALLDRAAAECCINPK
jgi:hypothetical protein